MTEQQPQPDGIDSLKNAYERVDLPLGLETRIQAGLAEARRSRRSARLKGVLVAGALVIVGFGLSMVLLSTPPTTEATAPEKLLHHAEIIKVSGTVNVSWGERHQPATARLPLPEGATIRTDRDGSAVIEIGPHRVLLDRASTLQVQALAKQQLAFSLIDGRTEYTVASLTAGSSFHVLSDGLTVSVVGTRFNVMRQQQCSIVEVTSGKVSTRYDQEQLILGAGAKQEFCPTETAVPEPTTTGAGRATRMGREASPPPPLSELSRALPSAKPTSPKAGRPSNRRDAGPEGGLTDEEKLIRLAQVQMAKRESRSAYRTLKSYLDRYPDGQFVEEAMFNLIRQCYKLRRTSDIVRYSERFLRRYPAFGTRSAEIRVIYAQILLEQGKEAPKAFGLLATLIERLDSTAVRYRGQVIYLYALAAYRTNRPELGRRWAQIYLRRFPNGRYADRVKDIIGSTDNL